MQNNKFFFVILIFINTFLLFYGSITHQRINLGESVIYFLSKPILQINKTFLSYGSKIVEDLQSKKDLKNEVFMLREENKKLKEEINRLKYLMRENIQLKKMLEFQEKHFFRKITARVIGGSNSLYQNIIIINKGENSGIREGMGVVDYNGVIGIVSRTYTTSAKVLLITDPRLKIDVKLLSTEQHGILTGKNNCSIVNYLPANREYRLNEMVITSGFNNIFPYGIPVGTVIRVEKHTLYKSAVVKPFFNKYSIGFVQVIVK